MRTVYVDILVIVFLIQILIGSSYELPYTTSSSTTTSEEETLARNCSTITCDDNARCEEDIHVFSCVCLPNYHLSNTTLKCELNYEWRKYKYELVRDTRLVNTEMLSGHKYTIARWLLNDILIIPCGVMLTKSGKIIGGDCYVYEEHPKLEVVLIHRGSYDWSKSNGIVPNNAIEGGKIGNETIYICQTNDFLTFRGWMQPSNGSCYVGGQIGRYFSTYDLLTNVN